MGLFDFYKKFKQVNNSEPTFEEILMPVRTDPQPPFLPTEKEPVIATGYEAHFKNGVLFNVKPRNQKNHRVN